MQPPNGVWRCLFFPSFQGLKNKLPPTRGPTSWFLQLFFLSLEITRAQDLHVESAYV